MRGPAQTADVASWDLDLSRPLLNDQIHQDVWLPVYNLSSKF